MTFHTQSKNGNKIKSDFKRFKAKRNRESERLRNSPHFCVFKTARAVKQKVWNEAENRERDWRETLKIGVCEARALRARKTLTPDFTRISLLILRKKPDYFAVYESDPCYHLSKKALKIKVPMKSWHKEIYNQVWKERNSSKGLNFRKKWRKNPKGAHPSIFSTRRWKSAVFIVFIFST